MTIDTLRGAEPTPCASHVVEFTFGITNLARAEGVVSPRVRSCLLAFAKTVQRAISLATREEVALKRRERSRAESVVEFEG